MPKDDYLVRPDPSDPRLTERVEGVDQTGERIETRATGARALGRSRTSRYSRKGWPPTGGRPWGTESPLTYMEDAGRHNAVDKIAGFMFKHRVPPHDKILYTTGRLPSEMVIKTVRMGTPIL